MGSHDQILQISVKKVIEILSNSTDDEEIMENLQDLSLDFFTEPEKSIFWSLKEENLDSCITGEALESQSGIVDKYLMKNDENNGNRIDTSKPEMEESSTLTNKIEEKP